MNYAELLASHDRLTAENERLKGRIVVFENALLDAVDVIEAVDVNNIRSTSPTFQAIQFLTNVPPIVK